MKAIINETIIFVVCIMDTKNIIIVVLLITLVLSLLGINILIITGNLLQSIVNFLYPFFSSALATLGYTTGSVINAGSNVVTNVAKTSLDIANGAIHNATNVLINASTGNGDVSGISLPNLSQQMPVQQPLEKSIQTQSVQQPLEKSIQTQSVRSNQIFQPVPSPSSMPIQNPISSSKTSYCLVGEFQEKRGCIEVGENDLCMSGQLFSSRELCMNPTLTPNLQPQQKIAPFNSVAMFPLPPILPGGQPNELRPKGIYNF